MNSMTEYDDSDEAARFGSLRLTGGTLPPGASPHGSSGEDRGSNGDSDHHQHDRETGAPPQPHRPAKKQGLAYYDLHEALEVVALQEFVQIPDTAHKTSIEHMSCGVKG